MQDATRSILISGCSGDFGFRAARALAQRGHTVVAGLRHGEHGREYRARLDALAAEGAPITCVELDVNRTEQVDAGVKAALAVTDGRLDVLVNTAAYSILGPLEACEPEQLLAMLDTNVVGTLRLLRAVLPVMRARAKGRIIQVGSGLGRAALPFMAPYAASAWAIEGFVEALSYEAHTFGVDVAILEASGYRDGGPPRKPVADRARLDAYQTQLVAFGEQVRREDANAGDPEEVARAVVAAVEADTVRLHTPVGADAEALVALRETLTTGEFSREIMKRSGLDEV